MGEEGDNQDISACDHFRPNQGRQPPSIHSAACRRTARIDVVFASFRKVHTAVLQSQGPDATPSPSLLASAAPAANCVIFPSRDDVAETAAPARGETIYLDALNAARNGVHIVKTHARRKQKCGESAALLLPLPTLWLPHAATTLPPLPLRWEDRVDDDAYDDLRENFPDEDDD